MRLKAVLQPELGTSSGVSIHVSYWYAAPGEEVLEGDRLVEVLVGPATFDVSSPFTGQLVKISAEEDTIVSPGAILGWVAVTEEDVSAVGNAETDSGLE